MIRLAETNIESDEEKKSEPTQNLSKSFNLQSPVFETSDEDTSEVESSFTRTARRRLTRQEDEASLLVFFKEKWSVKEERIRKASQFGKDPGWRLLPVIVKSGDDLRQEQFAVQLIRLFWNIFRELDVSVWLRPYG